MIDFFYNILQHPQINAGSAPVYYLKEKQLNFQAINFCNKYVKSLKSLKHD